jgi:hypothetical protein
MAALVMEQAVAEGGNRVRRGLSDSYVSIRSFSSLFLFDRSPFIRNFVLSYFLGLISFSYAISPRMSLYLEPWFISVL